MKIAILSFSLIIILSTLAAADWKAVEHVSGPGYEGTILKYVGKDAKSFWTPTKEDIARFEESLDGVLRSEKQPYASWIVYKDTIVDSATHFPISQYTRTYYGVLYHSNQRRVYAEFGHPSCPDHASDAQWLLKHEYCLYSFKISFDPAGKKFYEFVSTFD